MGQIISPEKLGVSKDDWLRVLRELIDNGYIKGVTITTNIIGDTLVDIANAEITLKGAAYLQENGAFAKFREIATNVINVAAVVKP